MQARAPEASDGHANEEAARKSGWRHGTPGEAREVLQVTPARLMTTNASIYFFTIDTTRALMYVVGSSSGVYANVDTANGAITPARSLTSGSGVSVDPGRDRVYVADVFSGVSFRDHASTGTGAAGTIPIPSAQFVTVDPANDRLYVGAYDKVYVIDDASLLPPGTLPPGMLTVLAPAGSSIGGFAF